jgi:hypothetical protein
MHRLAIRHCLDCAGSVYVTYPAVTVRWFSKFPGYQHLIILKLFYNTCRPRVTSVLKKSVIGTEIRYPLHWATTERKERLGSFWRGGGAYFSGRVPWPVIRNIKICFEISKFVLDFDFVVDKTWSNEFTFLKPVDTVNCSCSLLFKILISRRKQWLPLTQGIQNCYKTASSSTKINFQTEIRLKINIFATTEDTFAYH